jgi:hypothetical protein
MKHNTRGGGETGSAKKIPRATTTCCNADSETRKHLQPKRRIQNNQSYGHLQKSRRRQDKFSVCTSFPRRSSLLKVSCLATCQSHWRPEKRRLGLSHSALRESSPTATREPVTSSARPPRNRFRHSTLLVLFPEQFRCHQRRFPPRRHDSIARNSVFATTPQQRTDRPNDPSPISAPSLRPPPILLQLCRQPQSGRQYRDLRKHSVPVRVDKAQRIPIHASRKPARERRMPAD